VKQRLCDNPIGREILYRIKDDKKLSAEQEKTLCSSSLPGYKKIKNGDEITEELYHKLVTIRKQLKGASSLEETRKRDGEPRDSIEEKLSVKRKKEEEIKEIENPVKKLTADLISMSKTFDKALNDRRSDRDPRFFGGSQSLQPGEITPSANLRRLGSLLG
jgi:hypothetical protein